MRDKKNPADLDDEPEIKKPVMKDPKFFKEPFDYRNKESVGHFRGVGQPGKTGQFGCTHYDPMPPDAMRMFVPRDHEG
jgi:hypothetical protein